MKRLFVLRHAKASGPASAPTDFDRPLNPRGHRQAVDIGGIMRARHFDVDAIFASPALRVVETINGVIDGARLAVEPTYDPRAYNASPEALFDILREADDTVERLLIVGHNPGLQQLLLHIAEDDPDGLRGDIAFGFPTATLAELSLTVDHWREIGSGSGRIVSLVRPRDAED
jgi:phosphohistidine phosphatase